MTEDKQRLAHLRVMEKTLIKLQNKITRCKKCPRLVRYLQEINTKYPAYWCKPVPSFGDANAQILIVGLAPGRFGSNRTGRMFTGDSSGEFLYSTLHDVGLCNKDTATNINDGLVLKNCYITAVGRCAPPQNKPTPVELSNCFPYLVNELEFLRKVKVVVALGKIAFDSYLKWLLNSDARDLLSRPRSGRGSLALRAAVVRKKDFKFFHGALYNHSSMPHILVASYHPSRQNTQTGRLTKKMFKEVFHKALKYID